MILQKDIEKTMEMRKEEFHTLDEHKIMKEASFIYRRVIQLFAEDETAAHSLSLLWKYVVLNIDMVLNKVKLEVDKIKRDI